MADRETPEGLPPRPEWLSRRGGMAVSASLAVSLEEPAEIAQFADAPCDSRVARSAAPQAVELNPEAPDPRRHWAELTDFLPTDTVGNISRCPHLFWHPLQASAWIVRLLFGMASLILLLALTAAIPIVNFLALGYLLEAEGRLARTGRLRFMFPLLDLAPRLGSIALGVWLWLWPLRILSNVVTDAAIINPGGANVESLRALRAVAATAVFIHLCLALARGGGFWCFFRPIKNVRWLIQRVRDHDYWETAERGVREFVSGLRLGHHFWLGLRGFVGAAIWLWPPTILLAALRNSENGGQVLFTLVGGVLMLLVFAWVPFLQARFAAENRFRAMFELGAVRELFRKAPIAWLISILFIYVLALPLYLFKIASPPQDAMWGVTIVFIVSIYPARILTGWAYHRAWVKPKRAWFGFRWLSRLLMIPLLGMYVFLLFFTQYISEHGRAVLFEHHAFLLPVPF